MNYVLILPFGGSVLIFLCFIVCMIIYDLLFANRMVVSLFTKF